MARRPHEDVANLQCQARQAACWHRNEGRIQAGMQERSNTGTHSRTTLFNEIIESTLHVNHI